MSSTEDSTLASAERIEVGALHIADSAALGGSSSSTRFVSPWTADSNTTNHNVVFQHNLGAHPATLSVQFSVDLRTVHPLIWPWNENSSGNPVSVWMDDHSVTLSIFSGTYLHGWWDGTTGAWTTTRTGYWRVIASV